MSRKTTTMSTGHVSVNMNGSMRRNSTSSICGIKQLVYWSSLLLSSMVVVMNVLVLRRYDFALVTQTRNANSNSNTNINTGSSEYANQFYQSLPYLRRQASFRNQPIQLSPTYSSATAAAAKETKVSTATTDTKTIKTTSMINSHHTTSYDQQLSTYDSMMMWHKEEEQVGRKGVVDSGNNKGKNHHVKRSRTLMGIITSDSRNDCSYRRRHRELFNIWNDTRVCSLVDFQENPTLYENTCQLVYTFVMGAADASKESENKSKNENGNTSSTTIQTLIVDDSIPLYRTSPWKSRYCDSSLESQRDITLLNIRENMNEGKSPTFFYFASTLMEELKIDYAMKFDGDSILHLHDWFLFAHSYLPPKGHGMMVGALRHKAYWPTTTTATTTRNEGAGEEKEKEKETKEEIPKDSKEIYWEEEYDGSHLYLAGQCYLISHDLCSVIATQASMTMTMTMTTPGTTESKGKGKGKGSPLFLNDSSSSYSYYYSYLEGHEDHDVTSMAFFSPTPVHLLTIGKSQRFWEHPVKGQPRWERIQRRETARMAHTEFEGKQLRLYLDV